MDNYPIVDLSIMIQQYKCAIRVTSKEDACAVVANAMHQFPGRTMHWSGETHYDRADENGLCYTMFFEGYDTPTHMSCTKSQWFVENGYHIIDFAELVSNAAEDLEESDQAIDVLIGACLGGMQ